VTSLQFADLSVYHLFSGRRLSLTPVSNEGSDTMKEEAISNMSQVLKPPKD
jgi:hypothetical protein